MSKVTRIHNYLDHLTIEEVLKYANAGCEFIINDGHVQAIIATKEAQDGERA